MKIVPLCNIWAHNPWNVLLGLFPPILIKGPQNVVWVIAFVCVFPRILRTFWYLAVINNLMDIYDIMAISNIYTCIILCVISGIYFSTMTFLAPHFTFLQFSELFQQIVSSHVLFSWNTIFFLKFINVFLIYN